MRHTYLPHTALLLFCVLVLSTVFSHPAAAAGLTAGNLAGASAYLPGLSPPQRPASAGSLAPVDQEPAVPAANTDANLRGGPGVNFIRMDTVPAGQPLPLSGRNMLGDWVRTNMGAWIAAKLVDDVPSGLPVVTGTYAAATQDELAYLRYVIHWHNQMVNTASEIGKGSNTVSAADMVKLPWQLRDWRDKSPVPPGLADLGEWVDRLLSNCALGENVKVDDEKMYECGRMMGIGFIPAKFVASAAAASASAPRTDRTPQAGVTPAAPAAPTSTPKPAPTVRPKPVEYKSMLANIWTGVKVYYGNGTEKAYGFEILGGGECSFGKSVYVQFEDGTREWKNRKALLNGPFYVRADDPATTAWQWYEYECYQ